MKIVDWFRRIRLRKRLLIPSSNPDYEDSIKQVKEKIINSMQSREFSKIEEAYYVYIELGKILSEDPINAFGEVEERRGLFNKKIGKELQGNCKAIAELYVSILGDIGINSDLIKVNENPGAHVDAVLNIEGKNYITNLIGDLSRIKTAKRVNSFAFNLENNRNIMYSPTYKDRVKKCYNLSFLPREEIERMDKKLGYSYSNESEKDNNKRGIYTEDVFERIKQELADPEKFKKYVLKGREDVREEDIFKYKLEFLLENMDKFSTYNSNARYLENIRYYFYTLKKFFSEEEAKRINMYACVNNGDFSKIHSIVKLRPSEKSKGENTYFAYNNTDRKYKEISREELKRFVDRAKGLEIIGEIDNKEQIDIEELEL